MYKIQNHPSGLLITTGHDGAQRVPVITLRQQLAVPVRPAPGYGAIVPHEYAYRILETVSEPIDWDPGILQMATRQLESRNFQLRAKAEVAHAVETAPEILSNYPLAANLDSHQIKAVAALCVPSLQGLALFDEQGTGKTIVTLCAFDRLRQLGQLEKMLVVAPKSVLGAWAGDAHKLFGDKYRLVFLTNKNSRRTALAGAFDILVLNYEKVVTELPLLRALVSASPNGYFLAIDESYLIKNPDAARTKAVTELRQYCKRAVVLCGTPAPNSPVDVVHQINVIDFGLAFGGKAIPKDRQQAMPVVAQALEDAIYLRRLKKDVLVDLTAKEIERISFDLSPRQRELYERARDELVLAVRSVDDKQFAKRLATFLAQRSALLQICSHPGSVDPLYSEVPAKHLVLDQLLWTLIAEQHKKVVIWSYYRYSIAQLTDRYSHYGLVRIDGSIVDASARTQAIAMFQNEPGINIFLGNAAAAGAGITLTAAHHAIYESFSNQAAHYMQSVDRIHRRGQGYDVLIHVLTAHDTVEEREFDRILNKEKVGKTLLGDTDRQPITRERFLADLGSL